jgi:hypothetical protein
MPRRTPDQLDALAAVVCKSNTSRRQLALKYVRLLDRCHVHEETLEWVERKLYLWEKLLVEAKDKKLSVSIADVATCREIRHALDGSNPRLAKKGE